MREDALANHAGDSRKEDSRRNESRASGGDRLRGGFGGALFRAVVRRGEVGVKRTFFWIASYGSDSTKDRLSIAMVV
jgi:hypothetical protein